MSSDYIYWSRGFNYERKKIGNRVILESYKILIYFTAVNNNFRVGVYLNTYSNVKFYSLKRIIPNFTFFEEVMDSNQKILKNDIPQILKDINGLNIYDDIESILKLESPIILQYQSKTIINDFIGYKFNNPLSIVIEPHKILSVKGNSLKSFIISMHDFNIEISFGNQIKIF